MKSIKIEVPAKIILTCANFPVMSEDEVSGAILAAEMAMNGIGCISDKSAGGAAIGVRVHMEGSTREVSIQEAFRQLAIAAKGNDWGKVKDVVEFIRHMRG